MNSRRSEENTPAAPSRAQPFLTKVAKIWLAEDGIVHIESTAHHKQSLPEAIENVAGVAHVAAGVRRPLLVHFQRAAPQSPEARAHYTSEAAAQAVCAVAIVTSSVLGRVVANLMLRMTAPLPIQLFESDEAAQQWLLENWKPSEHPRFSQQRRLRPK